MCSKAACQQLNFGEFNKPYPIIVILLATIIKHSSLSLPIQIYILARNDPDSIDLLWTKRGEGRRLGN